MPNPTKFIGELNAGVIKRVEECNDLLTHPGRLAALRRTGLLDATNDAAFERLASLAARILKVPMTIVSLVSDDKQFFKAAFGLPEAYEILREIPIDDSVCRYTLNGDAIITSNAGDDALLMNHPSTKPWNIGAFIALPMVDREGFVLGAFCAVDSEPRPWSDEDIYVMKELTASVMTEIYLRSQVAELKMERGMREQFVATLSHDLRTPLNVAKMASELLIDQETDGLERLKLAKMVGSNMDRADKMITDLLDVTRFRAGGAFQLEKETGALQPIVTSALEALSAVYGPRLVSDLALSSEEYFVGSWDRSALTRVIENLVSNAFKYGSVETPVTISVREENSQALISVHNRGASIPPEKLESLFGIFERSQSAIDSTQKGWGIGLSLVRGLVDAHGGTVRVESTVAAGTVFTVCLPTGVTT